MPNVYSRLSDDILIIGLTPFEFNGHRKISIYCVSNIYISLFLSLFVSFFSLFLLQCRRLLLYIHLRHHSWLISALVIHLYKIHISKRGAVRRHMLPQR